MKVIYIDFNDGSGKYPNSVKDGDAFYTYGFGGLYAREFKKYNPDWEVECWKADSRSNEYQEKVISGVKFRVFPAVYFKMLGYYSSQLGRELKKLTKGSGVIVNISSGRHLLFLQIASLCKNIPLVVQHHGETTSIFDLKHRKSMLSKLRALVTIIPEKLAFKNVKHYFVLDIRLAEYFPKSFRGTFSVQTTGVDPELFKPIDKSDARRELDLPLDKKYILYIGRIGDHKRFDILLKIYLKLQKERTDLQLLVAGNRSGDRFEKDAVQAGVKIFGVIKQTELRKYLSAADVYVLPMYKNIHTFGGVGMLPLQATLCNTPVVGASLKTVNPEIIKQIGIYAQNEAEIERGIIQILDGHFEIGELRETVISEYSWNATSMKTQEIYTKILRDDACL
jgi:glycosyltransferase involved in cell wall biosynthesis